MDTLPTISKKDIDPASEEAHELIYLLTSGYRNIMAADASGQIQNSFTTEQNVLMAFEVLDGQVCNGGFLQLIENGYGAYIFDTLLSDHLRSWGLVQTADLIDRAKMIYEPKKEVLEKKKTLAEFAKLYLKHPEFDPFDTEYYEIADAEREVMKSYVLTHIGKFVQIV